MEIQKKIVLFLFLLSSNFLLAQTAGFNYQALILGDQKIQIPGTDVTQTNQPLVSEEIILRFTITTEDLIEYIEEHKTTTDEFGMVSLIVGDGESEVYNFSDINWDGKLKYLKVELNILSNDLGFLLLDEQKILYIPQPGNNTNTVTGYGNVKIVNSLNELTPPFKTGDLVWITNYGANNNTSLLIWDSNNWLPVNEDFDTINEIGINVVDDNFARSTKYPNPKKGNQVWNKACNCLQVYDDSFWVSIFTEASNGVSLNDGKIKLGGNLTEPTIITTDNTNSLAIKGLQNSTDTEDQVVLLDKNSGILKQRDLKSLITSSQSKEVVFLANDGQVEFTTPLKIRNKENINVFRNGINISFEVINDTTIKLEPEAICYKNDKIRIVQLY